MKMKSNKVSYEHLVPSVARVAEAYGEWPEVTRVIPGKVRGTGKPHTGHNKSETVSVTLKYRVFNGVKIQIVAQNFRQEFFLTSADPERLIDRLRREIPTKYISRVQGGTL
jgi:hypothetical protein